MISTKQLLYFDAVARHRHFGKAAEDCAVTQPALSMQIQELERELGVALIERGRTIVLTAAGEDVARRAARVLDELAAIKASTAEQRPPLTGRLRLGVIPSIAPYVLPAVLPRLKADYPKLELRIRETLTDYLVAQLEDSTLDVALLALPIAQAGIDALPLFDDPFLLAMPDQPPKPRQRRASRAQLETAPLLLLEEGHCLRDQALSFCSQRDLENVDSFGASSLSTLVQMVASGLGQTLLPEMSVSVEGTRPGVRLMRFRAPEPSRQIGLAFRKTSPLRADFDALGAVIMAARPAASA
ncbi:LysR substrate-binding domain-containing protein [Pyruvatibacter mobilis]|uniref:LysR substrate-binding domain-containing protein n=1 Tax=Pyruvatibacter mobilis TaxID=1712261 RepID=UPI003D0FE200